MNIESPQPPAPVMSERKVSLLSAMLASIGPISMAIYTPAMPEIVKAFGTSEAMGQLSLSLYFAAFSVAQLFAGPISDGIGRRPVIISFMTIYAFASLVAVFAPTIEVLLAARAVQGVGAAAGVAISRAIVRDLFTHERSARIMNLIGIIMVTGPGFAPIIGGLTMEVASWHAIFALMLAAGATIAATATFALKETVVRDLSRIRPRALLQSYAMLLGSARFVTASLVVAAGPGAIYTLATLLPFILMERVGLTPGQYGVGMLMQPAGYLLGSLVLRRTMPRYGAFGMVPIGLACFAVGALGMALVLRFFEPTYLNVMLPIAVYTFGVGVTQPAMTTAALAPFPRNAGAAAALMGFMQMGGGGIIGGSIAAYIGDPIVCVTSVAPCFGLVGIVSYLIWRRLPEPQIPLRP